MRHVLTLCLFGVCSCLAVARAEPLTFLDQWTAGGQPIYGQARISLSATCPAGLQGRPSYPAATVRYGVLSVSDEHRQKRDLLVALASEGARPVALFLDSDASGSLEPREWARPAAEADRPPGFGQAGEALWLTRSYAPDRRIVALRLSPIGGMLVAAVRGAYQAQLPSPAGPRTLLVVDANADLALQSGTDYAYLDVNGDGLLDPAKERFADLGLIEAGGLAVQVGPLGPAALAQWAPVVRGETPVTFTLGAVKQTPAMLQASLTRDNRETVAVSALGQAQTLASGSYTVDSLAAKVVAPEGTLRSYTFEHDGGEGFNLQAGQAATIDLLGRVTVSISADGKPAAGNSLDLEVFVTTSTGLRMTACSAGEQDAQQQGLVPPQIEFRAPDGTVLESGPMEFG